MAARQFNVFLLKEDESPSSAVRADAAADRHALRRGLGFTGYVYVRRSPSVTPSWVSFLNEGLAEALQQITNRHNSALLCLTAEGRSFAITFGYGRSLLRDDAYERRFGLRVVLNRVDPQKLRSLDTHVFEDLAVQTKRQVSRPTGVANFGIDLARDIVRAVTGEPDDPVLGRRISGSDSVVVSVERDFEDLDELCGTLLQAYEDDRYKESFGWVDHVARVTDKALIRTLDSGMVEQLCGGDTESVYLAPPEPVEWGDIEGVRYRGTRDAAAYPDLDMDKYVELVHGPENVTLEGLKRHRVDVISARQGAPLFSWSLYDCVVHERQGNPALFALVGGDWLQAELGFTASVEAELGAIQVATLDLPSARRGEDEEDYNVRAAQERSGLACLDRQFVRMPDTGPIEACDLFGQERVLRHLKQRRSSAMLSHLWNQGLVSSELLASTRPFREQLVSLLASHPLLAAQIDLDRFDPRQFRVQFGLIGGRRSPFPAVLPFFSKVSLVNVARRLRLYGFTVELMHIPRTA